MQGPLAGKRWNVGDGDGPQPHPADQGQVVFPGWEKERVGDAEHLRYPVAFLMRFLSLFRELI